VRGRSAGLRGLAVLLVAVSFAVPSIYIGSLVWQASKLFPVKARARQRARLPRW
jgi:hypothetical protein